MLGGGSRSKPTLSALDENLQSFDLAKRNVARVASVEFLLGVEFIERLLKGALRLLDLAFGCRNIGPRHGHCCVRLGDAPARRFHGGLLLGTVQLEDRGAFFDVAVHSYINFGNTAACFGENRNGSEKGRHVCRRWMIVEYDCNQRHRQHQARSDAPSQLEPD